MKRLLFIASAALLFSCGGENHDHADHAGHDHGTEETVNVEITKHGADINEEGAISGTDLITQFEGKDSLETKVVATINEVCAKKGCWMTLNLDDEQELMVRFKDYEFFVPKDASGKEATIEGIARMETISVAEQQHYLEDANASQEEIDAITEPEVTFTFEATGVIIKGESIAENDVH